MGACSLTMLMQKPFMPAKARDLQKVAGKLGFRMVRQKGNHDSDTWRF